MKFTAKLAGDEEKELCEVVDAFANEMKKRLVHKLNVEGFDGWDLEHLKKDMALRMAQKADFKKLDERTETDFIDIANFSMFLWNQVEETNE